MARGRVQDLGCEKRSAVERDLSLSSRLPGWILTCDEHRYRVELIPHKQTRVTRSMDVTWLAARRLSFKNPKISKDSKMSGHYRFWP
jgi:hypothetical protein